MKQGDTMGTKLAIQLTAIWVLSSLFPSSLWAGSAPLLNQGQKWRIGYYEGGAYSEYTRTMGTLVPGLIELGWIKGANPPEYHDNRPKPYWDWLTGCDSPYLSFRAGDSYSANWDDDLREVLREEILNKLKSNSLDLVIAMGTWAGLDLANHNHSVPVMVLSTSDPIGAGIIKSAENSGYEHVTARVDPNRYLRQLRMFHRIVGFETLGVAYENTPVGRTYSAIREVEQISGERGFKTHLCEVIDTTTDTRKSDQSCLDCYRQLAQKSDAVYITALSCVDRQTESIRDLFREARIPSFAMVGSKMVEAGMMLSISSDSGYSELGRYNANKFGEILNGTKPIDLKQLFEDPLDVAVNIETVRQIGFTMPESILKIAAETYEK